jgi:hypothetical protein
MGKAFVQGDLSQLAHLVICGIDLLLRLLGSPHTCAGDLSVGESSLFTRWAWNIFWPEFFKEHLDKIDQDVKLINSDGKTVVLKVIDQVRCADMKLEADM